MGGKIEFKRRNKVRRAGGSIGKNERTYRLRKFTNGKLAKKERMFGNRETPPPRRFLSEAADFL